MQAHLFEVGAVEEGLLAHAPQRRGRFERGDARAGQGEIAQKLKALGHLDALEAPEPAEALLGHGPASVAYTVLRAGHGERDERTAVAAVQGPAVRRQERVGRVDLDAFELAFRERAGLHLLRRRAHAQRSKPRQVEDLRAQLCQTAGQRQVLDVRTTAKPVGIERREFLGENDLAQAFAAAKGAGPDGDHGIGADRLLDGRQERARVGSEGDDRLALDLGRHVQPGAARLAALHAHLCAVEHDVAPHGTRLVHPLANLGRASGLDRGHRLELRATCAGALFGLQRAPTRRHAVAQRHGGEPPEANVKLAGIQ